MARRTVDALWDAIGIALDDFSPEECFHYFRNAGYGSTALEAASSGSASVRMIKLRSGRHSARPWRKQVYAPNCHASALVYSVRMTIGVA
jgi:hypothetical protein